MKKKSATNKGLAVISIDDIERAPNALCCSVFRVSDRTLNNWIQAGCPRNQDMTFSIYMIHKWLIEKGKANGIREEKTLKEIELLETKILMNSDKYIEREEHLNMIRNMITALKKGFDQAIKKNIHHFAMKEIEQLKILLPSFRDGLFGAFADAGK